MIVAYLNFWCHAGLISIPSMMASCCFYQPGTGRSLCLLMWMGSLLLLNAVWLWIVGSALASWALRDRSKTQHCIREWQHWFTSHMSCKQRDVDSSHASCVSKRFSRRFDGSYHAISGFRPEVCVCTCLVSPPHLLLSTLWQPYLILSIAITPADTHRIYQASGEMYLLQAGLMMAPHRCKGINALVLK